MGEWNDHVGSAATAIKAWRGPFDPIVENEEAVAGLLADLRQFCEYHGLDFDQLVAEEKQSHG